MYKLSLVALAVLSVTLVMAETPQNGYYDLADAQIIFDAFVENFDRKYKDDADRKVHNEAFVKNLQKINELNKKSSTATFRISKFADYTEEESKHLHGYKAPVGEKALIGQSKPSTKAE